MAKIDEPLSDLVRERSRSQTLSILAGNTLTTLMMLTVAMGLAQAGARIVPAWHGGYLVWISLALSLEAIYTRKRADLLEGREKLLFRISEWVAIAVAIKIFLYLVHEPAQLLTDLPLWQENFIEHFFTAEYVLALLFAVAVWLSISAYAHDFEDLYEREKDAAWDELGKLQNALKDTRRRISSRVFTIGTLVVIFSAVSRVDASSIFREYGAPPPGYQSPVINVLVYFILALVLLSLTQFALMRTRWLSQRLPVSPAVAKNWLQYGLVFFAILAVIVFFLPTEYSLSLLDTLRYSLDFLVKAVTFLFVLLTLPLTFCLSLFRITEPIKGETQPAPSFEAPPPAAPHQPQAWLEVLRSLAFWAIFIGIVGFAIRFYLMQNSELLKAIANFPLIRWLSAGLSGLWNWLKGANREIALAFRKGIKRIRPTRARLPAQAIRRLFNPARLHAREKIFFYYLSLVKLGGERGLERPPSETPYQYEIRLSSVLPDLDQDFHDLTHSFIEARYSRHSIDEPQAAYALNIWERIKAALRNWHKPN